MKGKEAEENNISQLNLQCLISYEKPEMKMEIVYVCLFLAVSTHFCIIISTWIKNLKKLKTENLLELSHGDFLKKKKKKTKVCGVYSRFLVVLF